MVANLATRTALRSSLVRAHLYKSVRSGWKTENMTFDQLAPEVHQQNVEETTHKIAYTTFHGSMRFVGLRSWKRRTKGSIPLRRLQVILAPIFFEATTNRTRGSQTYQ